MAKKWILLLSGGLDSTTALYWLRSRGDEVKALAIDYGQRHRKELLAAEKIAAAAQVEFKILDMKGLRPLISESSQTSNLPVPEGHYTEDSMKQTVVPNRNMILLSLAMGWAVNLKWNGVAYAAHAGDHTIYPDCRPEFVDAMRAVGHLCDWHDVEILTPFIHKTKSEIVRIGAELNVPYEMTWSCYQGSEKHCGRCGTCVERREAFLLARVPDPTEYSGHSVLTAPTPDNHLSSTGDAS